MTTDESTRFRSDAPREWPCGAAQEGVSEHDIFGSARADVLEGFAVGRQQAARVVSDVLRTMTRGYRSRLSLRQMQSLDDRVLRDIGVSRVEVVAGLCGIEFKHRRNRHGND